MIGIYRRDNRERYDIERELFNICPSKHELIHKHQMNQLTKLELEIHSKRKMRPWRSFKELLSGEDA